MIEDLMKMRFPAVILLIGIAAAACGSAGTPLGVPLTAPQLKYRLIDRFGPPAYCDPDFYPLARLDVERANADAMYEKIRSQADVFDAIAEHEHLPLGGLDEPQKLLLYRGYKLLSVLALTRDGDAYRFSYTAAGKTAFLKVAGTVRTDGVITVTSQSPGDRPNCPICLSATTLIATPAGDIAVTRIEPGMLVWSVDASGARVLEPVLKTGSVAVPAGHVMVRLSLADGRTVLASPGHRLSDGRTLGSLKVGDVVDGARVSDWRLVPYDGARTYDLLPAGATGFYWADGIPLASTLSGAA